MAKSPSFMGRLRKTRTPSFHFRKRCQRCSDLSNLDPGVIASCYYRKARKAPFGSRPKSCPNRLRLCRGPFCGPTPRHSPLLARRTYRARCSRLLRCMALRGERSFSRAPPTCRAAPPVPHRTGGRAEVFINLQVMGVCCSELEGTQRQANRCETKKKRGATGAFYTRFENVTYTRFTPRRLNSCLPLK